jgi:hypothetical protein
MANDSVRAQSTHVRAARTCCDPQPNGFQTGNAVCVQRGSSAKAKTKHGSRQIGQAAGCSQSQPDLIAVVDEQPAVVPVSMHKYAQSH